MAARKKAPPPPTADEVRRNLVQWFYQLNKKGGAARGMQNLCKGIKDEYGYKRPLVREHLTFLCDLAYIHREIVRTQVQTGQTIRDRVRTTYRIGAKGIEFMEGRSEFSEKARYPGINLTATGGSTVVLGDGNIVNGNYQPLYDELGRLLLCLADSSELNDSAKLEASVHIETIRDQLALNRPDRIIVEKAWELVRRICTTAALVEPASRVAPRIAALFA